MDDTIHIGGHVKPGFEVVREAFKANFENGTEEGGSFAAYYRGELVVNLWGGHSDKESNRLWREDDVTCLWSTTKALSAIVIGHLVDRGLLDYKEKVSTYWPEFAQNGKADVTLEELLAHRAGVCAIEPPVEFGMLVKDPKEFGKHLAEQKPYWKPGRGFGYHGLTFALYLDQIVRRVDHKRRSLSQYFQEEIAEPFGVDIHIGLPPSLHYRSARIKNDTEIIDGFPVDATKGNNELLTKIYMGFPDFQKIMDMNNPAIQKVPNGSSNGFGTAEAIAKIHGILANGGTYNGRTLLSKDTIAKFQVPISWGEDEILGVESYVFSTGFVLCGIVENDKKSSFAFGHPGYGGQLGIADSEYKVGLAYTTCKCCTADGISREPSRIMPVYEALMQCIRATEGHTGDRKFHLFYPTLKAAGFPIRQ